MQLLSLWESKINLEDVVLLQLKNPVESWAAFEKGLIEEFPQVVATINQHIDATFEVMYHLRDVEIYCLSFFFMYPECYGGTFR